jgi:hypothetical protein
VTKSLLYLKVGVQFGRLEHLERIPEAEVMSQRRASE